MIRSIDSSNGPEKTRDLPVILLAGPTAAGKTSLAIRLARSLGTEIVNADSMQVYRYMNIGTAKPTDAQRREVPHHVIDVADPDEPFDAARYVDIAAPIIEELHGRGEIPIVVGGTGLYMKVLTRGICAGPTSDPRIKEDLVRDESSKGLSSLHLELARVDPEAATRIHPHDRQRIFRALEVFRATGVPLSLHQKEHGFEQNIFPTIKLFIFRDREELYERINRRVELMLEEGLKSEVEKLLGMGYGAELRPMQSLGYRQMAAHLLGDLSFDRAVYLIQRETRRYAKRQITWFRADPEFHWLHAEDFEAILSWISGKLKEGRGDD
jgi:tRNA dimethylallyltransferase